MFTHTSFGLTSGYADHPGVAPELVMREDGGREENMQIMRVRALLFLVSPMPATLKPMASDFRPVGNRAITQRQS